MLDADLDAIVRLRQIWDVRATGRPWPAVGGNQELAAAVERLHALDAAATELSAHPLFVRRLEAELMNPRYAVVTAPVASLPDRAGGTVAPGRLPWQASLLSAASVAAIVALILASVYVIYRQPVTSDSGDLPALIGSNDAERNVPLPEECSVEPVTVEQLSPPGTPTTTSYLPTMRLFSDEAPPERFGVWLSERPRGVAAGPETVAAVTATMRELTACLNHQDPGRYSALFSDDYWRRNSPTLLLEDSFAWEPDLDWEDWESYPAAPEARMKAMPLVADVQVLPDGRVSALVVHPDDGTPVARVVNNMTTLSDDRVVARVGLLDPLDVVIFFRADDRWLVDEAAPVTDTKAVAMTYADGVLAPSGVTFQAGEPLLLAVRNDDDTRVRLGLDWNEPRMDIGPGAVGHQLLTDTIRMQYEIWDVDAGEDAGFNFESVVGSIHATSPMHADLSLTVGLMDRDAVPDEIRIPAQTEVTLWLDNRTTTRRSLHNEELGIDVDVEPGQRRSVAITAPAGGYELRYVGADDPVADTIWLIAEY